MGREPLPWDDPDSNPLEDIREFKKAWYESYTQFQGPNEEVPDFLFNIRLYEAGLAPLPEGHIMMIEHDSPGFKGQHQEGQTVEVPKADSVAIVSGGLDSTTLVYDMLDKGLTPHLLSFDYGQRHSKELIYAKATARRLGLRHDIVDLTGITHLISNSALTSQTGLTVRGMNFDGESFHPNIEVPEGHYAAETMKATVVPNRNMIMLSIAAGVGVNNGYKTVGIGVHAGDHDVYPDCRPRFINATVAAILAGNQGFGAVPNWEEGEPLEEQANYLFAPFIHLSKADIAYRALQLKVPLHLTWSCYKGGDIHCGRCSTCVERLEAIDEAQQRWFGHYDSNPPSDNTEYADTEYWKQAVREFKEKQNG